MTPAEWTALLDVVAKVEAIEAHHAGRIHRDPRGLKLAREAVRALRSTVAVAAPGTPALSQPEPPQWAWASEVARLIGVEKKSMSQRCRRGESIGIARKVGGRWQVRLDLMAPGRGRSAR